MTEQTPGAGKVIWNWWADHLHADSGAARGLAARLRRADRPAEVLAEPWVFDLSRQLALRDPATLCALASVLAQVREHVPRRLARLLGTGDPKPMSALRFQRLMRTTDLPGLTIALRRALPLTNHTCDVAALGRDILFWSEKTRIDWCFDYFGAAQDAPATGNNPVDTPEDLPA